MSESSGFSLDVDYPATNTYIAFSFVFVALSAVPVGWQLKHNQAGPASLGFWLLLTNTVNGINAAIWKDNAKDLAPVWCDISAKVDLVNMTGALFAALGIVRFIARAVSPSGRRLGPEELRRLNLETYGLSFGAPLLMAALHILYQPNRYAIVRTTGCEFTYVVTWVSYLTWLIWGPLLSGVSAFYAGYICMRMWKNRRDLRKYAMATGMPASRFFRLVAMCCGFIGVSLPLTLFATFSATTIEAGGPWLPYSYHIIHTANDHKFSVPVQVLQSRPSIGEALSLLGGAVYVVFFSFAKETRGAYAAFGRLLGLDRLFSDVDTTTKATDGATAIKVEVSKG